MSTPSPKLKRTYTRGDQRPALKVRFVERDAHRRTPANLTGVTSVMFTLATKTDKAICSGACTILDAPAGLVVYQWRATDLDVTPGEYRGWFTISYDGELETKSDLIIEVRKRPS